MGKFYETNSTYRGSSYRGSSYRGSNYRGNNYRGASNAPPRGGYIGRIEGRDERPDARTDARYHLQRQAAQRNNSEHIIDARNILRNNSYRDNQNSPRRDFDESSRGRNDSRNDNGREIIRRGIGPRRGSCGASGHNDDRPNSRGRFNSERRGDRDDYSARDRKSFSSGGGGEGNKIRVTVPGLKKSRGDSYSQERSSSRQRRSDSSRQINSSSRVHYVTKEKNTTTIDSSSNEISITKRKARSRSNSPDFRPSKDRSGREKSNSMKFEPIKIQILNSNYVPPSANNSNNPNKSEDSMDYESSSSEYDVNKYHGTNKSSNPGNQQTAQIQALTSAQQQPQQSPASSSVLGLTPVAAALLQNSSLSSLNAFNSSYKQPGLVNVNNFPAAASGIYSNGYDQLWNTNLNHQLNSLYTSNKASAPPVAEIPKEPAQSTITAKSSKEGYKLLVSNLHPKVSEDDVLELFSDIGPIKRARFIDKGLAEVIYVRIEHAKEAIDKYDLKELDGRQMVIGFADKSHLTSSTEQSAAYNSQIPPPVLPSSSMYSGGASSLPYMNHSKTIENSAASYYEASHKLSREPVASTLSERFKSKSQSTIKIPESKHIDKSQSINHVDSSIIHQVLFKKAPSTNGAPVTFTVKL